MELRHTYREMIERILENLDSIDLSQVECLLEALIKARDSGKKILLVGIGRSGLVARAFAMRLMPLGFKVYVIGETITPKFNDGDVVLIISGSGRTSIPVAVSGMAEKIGVNVVILTSYPNSPVGRISDEVIFIPGREEVMEENEFYASQLTGQYAPLNKMNSLFENTCTIFLDSIISELVNRLNMTMETQ
jgi:6-phospho-3-hexuloisomerase